MSQKLSRNLSELPSFNLHMDELEPYTRDIRLIREYRNALLYHRNEFLSSELKQNYTPFCGDDDLKVLTMGTLQNSNRNRDFSKLAVNDPRTYFQYAIIKVHYSTDQDNVLPILVNLITLYAPGFLKDSETANEHYLVPMFDAFKEQQISDDKKRIAKVRTLIKEIWHQNLVDADLLKSQLKLNVSKFPTGNVNDAIDKWIEFSYVKFQVVTKGCDLPSEGYSNALSETPFQNFDMLMKYAQDPIGTCRSELDSLKPKDTLQGVLEENKSLFNKQPGQVVSIVPFVEDFAKMVMEPIRMNYILFYIIFTVFWNSSGDYILANTPLKIPQAINWNAGVSEDIFNEFNTDLLKVESQPPFSKKYAFGENSFAETTDQDSFLKNQIMDIFTEDNLITFEKNSLIVSMSMIGETVIERYKKHVVDLKNHPEYKTSKQIQNFSRLISIDITRKLAEMQENPIATMLYQQIRFPLLDNEAAYQIVNDNTTKIRYNQLNGSKTPPTVLFETEMMPTLPIPGLALSFDFLKSFDTYLEMQQELFKKINKRRLRENRSLLESKTGPVTDLDLIIDDKGAMEVTVHQRLIIV